MKKAFLSRSKLYKFKGTQYWTRFLRPGFYTNPKATQHIPCEFNCLIEHRELKKDLLTHRVNKI